MTHTPSLASIQRAMLARLQSLIAERAAAEQAQAEAYQAAMDLAERDIQRARKSLAATRRKAMEEFEAEKTAEATDAASLYDGEASTIETTATDNRRQIEQKIRIAEAKLKNDHKDQLWTADSLHEAAEKENDSEKARNDRTAAEAEHQIQEVWQDAEKHLAPFGLDREAISFKQELLPTSGAIDPAGRLEKSLEEIDSAAEKLHDCLLPKFVGLWGTVWCVVIAGGISAAIAALMTLDLRTVLAIALGGAVLGGLLLRQLFWLLARKQLRDRGTALGVFLSEAERSLARFRKYAELHHSERKTENHRRYVARKQEIDAQFLPRLDQVTTQGRTVIEKIESERATQLAAVKAARLKRERESRMHFANKEREIVSTYNQQLGEAEALYAERSSAAESARAAAGKELADNWFQGLEELRQQWHKLDEAAHAFPTWSALQEPSPRLAEKVPLGILFGTYQVDQLALPEGMPKDESLVPQVPLRGALPAFLPFPDRASVLFRTRNEGRADTIVALQAIMLRYLTGLPAGKVRFTIIDPVGLGENFAAFMHLADYDEQLVSSRIWTEPQHIEARLTDLTEHMENVIQKYLRNQYSSIEDYNRAAGEVAEPYRVLVIANFPANFTPDAARRLISIASSGPACGVCTLMSVDTAATMPRDFRLADLEQVSFVLKQTEQGFKPADNALSPFPLQLDEPPTPQAIAAIVKRVGEASRQAKRVEVPFSFIAPSPDAVWTSSTRNGFDIPIGRAGATRQQHLILGQGTAQHALIAGKTGSGKSTLLHALITNLALMYSPDEAELYLIDFKKGVEFKMYAEERLPHARVIAIESEREFGISVLQRLDNILRERGDLYREVGANDVASYRQARPEAVFPRIMLIVDEFQEFFVEDDKLAQEASLLLDRLVRQGRAFGVHVLLGSQTLGGAYSIPRATIDQMAVRIALQCSDADAQLILNKDNTAARLLSRPGDAIYNDANGMLEGNDPFQVVWLPEEQRVDLLRSVRQKASHRHDPKTLVFEGSRTLRLAECGPLLALRESLTSPPTFWLGDAVAIKEPTSARFRAESASNLLQLGQNEESALGIVSAFLVAIRRQLGPQVNQSVRVLDGTPDDAETADLLRGVCAALEMADCLVERAAVPSILSEWAQELEARQKGETADRTPRFLVVQGLQRFRELRKPEDDFGFGKRDAAVSPGAQFATLLRDGPALGIHVLIWCDSLTNFQRALDRQALREFRYRVLFQMSANDSSQLLDSPAASKLGRSRALFVEEGLERPEKFRPYGLPELEWLRDFRSWPAASPELMPA